MLTALSPQGEGFLDAAADGYAIDRQDIGPMLLLCRDLNSTHLNAEGFHNDRFLGGYIEGSLGHQQRDSHDSQTPDAREAPLMLEDGGKALSELWAEFTADIHKTCTSSDAVAAETNTDWLRGSPNKLIYKAILSRFEIPFELNTADYPKEYDKSMDQFLKKDEKKSSRNSRSKRKSRDRKPKKTIIVQGADSDVDTKLSPQAFNSNTSNKENTLEPSDSNEISAQAVTSKQDIASVSGSIAHLIDVAPDVAAFFNTSLEPSGIPAPPGKRHASGIPVPPGRRSTFATQRSNRF